MSFKYDENYFRSYYSTPFYRAYLEIRNRFIKREIVKYIPSGKFLEIGFGDDNLIKLVKNEFEVFGLDISEYAVERIRKRKRYNPSNFKICDISKQKIPFSQRFEVTCSVNVIEHLQDPEFALNNIYDSLRKEGIFVVYLPTQSNWFSRLQYEILYDVEEHVFRPSVKSLNELMRRIGFKRLKEYSANFIPLRISNKLIIDSFNLYFGIFRK